MCLQAEEVFLYYFEYKRILTKSNIGLSAFIYVYTNNEIWVFIHLFSLSLRVKHEVFYIRDYFSAFIIILKCNQM